MGNGSWVGLRHNPYNNEHVLELGPDGTWRKGQCTGLLENDCDQVVANMSLSRDLLTVAVRVGQHGGDVEHDLLAAELGEDTVCARSVVDDV